MNEYDSSRISDLMGSDQNYEMASCEEEADVLLLNTCSIRERAQEKVFHQLGRWRLLKNDNPDLVIGVGGCVASQEGQNIKKRAQYVDLVFGPQTIHRLPTMVAEAKSNQLPVIDVTFPELEKFDCLPEPGVAGPSAFVSIIAPGFVGDLEKMELAINLTRITFPFLFFICLASFFSAILNSHNKFAAAAAAPIILNIVCLLYTSPSPRDGLLSRMPSSA